MRIVLLFLLCLPAQADDWDTTLYVELGLGYKFRPDTQTELQSWGENPLGLAGGGISIHDDKNVFDVGYRHTSHIRNVGDNGEWWHGEFIVRYRRNFKWW